jgi:hypothetical protein
MPRPASFLFDYVDIDVLHVASDLDARALEDRYLEEPMDRSWGALVGGAIAHVFVE